MRELLTLSLNRFLIVSVASLSITVTCLTFSDGSNGQLNNFLHLFASASAPGAHSQRHSVTPADNLNHCSLAAHSIINRLASIALPDLGVGQESLSLFSNNATMKISLENHLLLWTFSSGPLPKPPEIS
jgi:hypothetical protein